MHSPVENGFFEPPPGYGWFDLGNPMAQGALPTHRQLQRAHPPTYGLTPAWPTIPPPYPGPPPTTPHSDYPGLNLPNHMGGTGTPFGYNFIFPQSTTVLHILKSARPPWSSPPQSIEMIPCTVPTLITIKELMKSLGCTNEDPKKNVLYEITQGGNGAWSVGMKIDGSQDSVTRLSLGEAGWGENRNGRDEDFVWLFLTKD